jgi:hypothetical protein
MPDAEYISLPQFLRWLMVKYAQVKTADAQVSTLSRSAVAKRADAQVSTLSRSVAIKPA